MEWSGRAPGPPARGNLGRSLRASRTPASLTPADIATNNQVAALGPMLSA